jgi:NAD(P)H-dependent FMN reductase
MNAQPIRVTVIVSSMREGRLAPIISSWFTTQITQRADMVTDVVDLNDYELPNTLSATDPAVVALQPHIAGADAFVIVVPEYNRSVPGPLKTAIDCYNEEWRAKPVGFVSYGLSSSGGLRAVEHLRLIFAEFHSVGMKDSVVFPRIMDYINADGTFTANTEGCNAAAKLMLDQLGWWAHALRDAKLARPYSG